MDEVRVNNPFIVGKYLSDKYFCDRLEETEFLRKQILNGRDVALISPRRIGKSGLIQHFFNQPDRFGKRNSFRLSHPSGWVSSWMA